MAKMSWRKSPPELIAAFDAAFPGAPAVKRKMFGYPAGFANGNMFMGLHQENWVLRLGESERAALLKVKGAGLFEPMPGHRMKDYVTLPPALIADRAELGRWIAKALKHAASLPPKAGKAKTAKKVAAKKRS